MISTVPQLALAVEDADEHLWRLRIVAVARCCGWEGDGVAAFDTGCRRLADIAASGVNCAYVGAHFSPRQWRVLQVSHTSLDVRQGLVALVFVHCSITTSPGSVALRHASEELEVRPANKVEQPHLQGGDHADGENQWQVEDDAGDYRTAG